MSLDYNNMSISDKEKILFTDDLSENEKFNYKICTLPMQCNLRFECDREQMVSYFQMAPLVKKQVPLEEADYIIYGHPFARIEDFTDDVLNDLDFINKQRKQDAEIIIVGKATNIKPYIENKYNNITYVESHFTEYLGKRFDIDMKEQYFVFDDRFGRNELNIWPVDGCLSKCGFCRRTYMNIPFESLSLNFIKEKLDWYKENNPHQMRKVRLRAENLTEYGLDIYGKQKLAKLIDLIDSYEEIKEFDMPIGMSIGEITDEILDALCRTQKLTGIALNLEAGSDRLLKLIGKKHNREQAIHVYNKLRETHKYLFINCTVMIGLPTENLEDILQLADLLEKTKPNNVLCNYYGYSPKHPIAKYEQIDENVRKYHLKFLIKLLKEQPEKDIPIRFIYESILDSNKRSHQRRLEGLKEQQKYSLSKLYCGGVKWFCGDNIVVNTEFNSPFDLEQYEEKVKQKRLKK